MSLPVDRRISQARTQSSTWDPIDYACSVKGYRYAFPFAQVCRALLVFVGLLFAVPLVVHFAARVFV